MANKCLLTELVLSGNDEYKFIDSETVAYAMLEVDRGDFAPKDYYLNRPIYIGYNVTISAPHMHAFALEHLAPFFTKGAKILDIGSGSGYLTVALSKMTGDTGTVVGIEHIPELYTFGIENVKKNHANLLQNKNIIFINEDGRKGYKKYGPYKVIHAGAASEELPKILDEIKTDFYSKIKEKVSIMKEKIKEEVNKYPLANIKEILQVLADNEKIKEKLIEDSKKETEIILNKSYDNSYHFNTLLIGQTGVGKSTLINGIFDFKENEGAKTGEGKPITENFDEYISNKRKCLRIIDSKGIEKGENNINKVFNSTKELIEKKAREGDPDKLIHCIWYCFKSSNLRFEDIEKNTLSLLMNQYDDNNLPIIIVITQNYDDKETEIMTKYITEEFKFLNRDITIIPVTAKEKIMEKKKNKFIIEKDGIEELLKISYEKSQKAIYPAILKSIKEKIIQTFIINTENKKNKLMDDLRETVEQLFNEVLENENLENNISKLSSVFEKTLNTFYEIPIISEKSQQDIADFLKNLSIWCVESLNDIILTLVKENSNELSRLLINEQTNVKNNHNVQKTLFNEKTIEQYTLDSENDLRPLITNEVYFLAVKEVYNLIAEKIVEIGEIVKKEEFDKIVPEFRNNISKEKLNQISNKILQNIVANN